MVDAVVVGSGPNGLVAAVALARAGRSVTVFEAAETIGGGCRSAESTLPGFVHDTGAAVHALAAASPVMRDLDLARHGLGWVHPEVPLAHPLDGGRAAVLHRSLHETAAAFGAGESAWHRRFAPLAGRWEHILRVVLGGPREMRRHPPTLARLAPAAIPSAAHLARTLGSDDAAALFGGCAAHGFLPLEHRFSSSFGTLLVASGHAVGWPVAKGGSQAVTDALAARLVEMGGTIHTNRHVRRMADLPAHRAVLFDTNPAQLAEIAGDRLPARFRRRLGRFRHGPAAFKIDYALDGPTPWTNDACRGAGTVHVGGSFDEIACAARDVAAGRMPERPFVLVAQQSLADRSRAPAGRHTLWAYAHVPSGYTGDATEAIERQIDRFAPGFRDLVLARHTTSPAAFASGNPNLVGGDIAGGAHDGLQLLLRPHAAGTARPTRES